MMKCEQILSMIEDYQSQELDAGRAADVSTHLRECASCRHELALLEQEGKIYQAYAAKTENALDVPPHLWKRAWEGQAAAKHALRGRESRRGAGSWLKYLVPASPWARQALAAVLLVAVSVTGTLLIVGHYRAGEISAVRQANPASDATGDRGLEAALNSVQRAEQEYLKAIQQLSTVVDKQKSTLDPRIVAELQTNLRRIDEHIAATRKAYYAHPRDPELALYMLAAYSRKVELLQELTS